MSWEPISEAEIETLRSDASARMSAEQARLWEVIKIVPEKWRLSPWGDEGGGFWVVGLIGRQVVWYNDIEDGFNISSWRTYGELEGYWCNQDRLEWSVQNLLNEIQSGRPPAYKMGPPEPISR